MVQEYKSVLLQQEFIDAEINLLLKQGWQLHGHTFVYDGKFCQVLIREAEQQRELIGSKLVRLLEERKNESILVTLFNGTLAMVTHYSDTYLYGYCLKDGYDISWSVSSIGIDTRPKAIKFIKEG